MQAGLLASKVLRIPKRCRRIREHITGVLRGHEQEVCGLKWSPSGQQLASGGNDNLLHVWSATGAGPCPHPIPEP